MKHLFILLSCFLFSHNLLGQINQYTFDQIGFTFSPPPGYNVVDSTSTSLTPNSQVTIWKKQYIFNKDENNLLVTISSSTQKSIDWQNIYKKEANHFFDQIKLQKANLQLDTFFSVIKIDSQLFNRFAIKGKENGQVIYNHIDLTNYTNGYKIKITFNFQKEENGNEIEKAIIASKFTK